MVLVEARFVRLPRGGCGSASDAAAASGTFFQVFHLPFLSALCTAVALRHGLLVYRSGSVLIFLPLQLAHRPPLTPPPISYAHPRPHKEGLVGGEEGV